MNAPTLGMRRVRTDFNPSDQSQVSIVKHDCAAMIDKLEALKSMAKDGEQARCYALAQTAIEEACMWAVKGLTA